MNAVTRGRTTLDTVEAFVAAAERFAVAVAWSRPAGAGRAAARAGRRTTSSSTSATCTPGRPPSWRPAGPPSSRTTSRGRRRARSSAPGTPGRPRTSTRCCATCRRTTPCWNFAYGAGLASFWPRRQLHETTVHQLDLDGSSGRSTELAPEVCARRRRRGADRDAAPDAPARAPGRPRPGRCALTATDTGDTWVVTPQPAVRSRAGAGPAGGGHRPRQPRAAAVGGAPPRRGGRVPDRVEAPAEVLYRLLWHRPVDESDVRVSGDEGRVRAFLGSRLTPVTIRTRRRPMSPSARGQG